MSVNPKLSVGESNSMLQKLRSMGLTMNATTLTIMACVPLLYRYFYPVPSIYIVGSVGIAALVWIFVQIDRHSHLTRQICALGGIAQVSLIVAMAGSFNAFQLDYHMFYFAWLAMLVMLVDWRVVLAAAALTAVHHLGLNFLFPQLVFPNGASFLRVVVHALAVVLQTGVLLWFTFHLERMLAALGTFSNLFTRMADNLDLSLSLPADEKSEMGRLGGAANKFILRLREVLQDVQTSSIAMNETASQLNQTSTQVKNRSHAQVVSANEIYVTMETTSNQIHTVAGFATQADGEAVRLKATSLKLGEVIERLQQDLNQISEINELIKSFSDQTNLLALNASIEAARAGDAGRGFAVVADEVRTLAGNVSKSVVSITERVNSLRENIAQASNGIGEMDSGITTIGESNRSVNNALTSQVAAAEEVRSTVENFKIELQQTVQEIEMSMDSVGHVSEQTERLTANTKLFHFR